MILRTNNSLSGARVLVAGAGVFGAATAAELARRGAAITLVDRQATLDGPSAVAAGMIAPALEAALDASAAPHAAWLKRAASRWTDFAEAHRVEIRFAPTRWAGPREPMKERLEALGFTINADGERLWVEGEALVDARETLGRLRSARGVTLMQDEVLAVDANGRVRLAHGGAWDGDAVVVALGHRSRALTTQAPALRRALDRVSPIKGQILTLTGEGVTAVTSVVRAPDVYLAPQPGRVLVGATMEPGRDDAEIDPAAVARLRAAAVRVEPALEAAVIAGVAAGVRGASPDGLPMVGEVAPGLVVALAPRRNGWLLGPLVAETVAAAIARSSPGSDVFPMRPDRFDAGAA
jgi:glycine oxidase